MPILHRVGASRVPVCLVIQAEAFERRGEECTWSVLDVWDVFGGVSAAAGCGGAGSGVVCTATFSIFAGGVGGVISVLICSVSMDLLSFNQQGRVSCKSR